MPLPPTTKRCRRLAYAREHVPEGARPVSAKSILLESSDYHGVENNRSFYRTEPHLPSFSVNHGIGLVFPDKSREERPLSRVPWKMLFQYFPRQFPGGRRICSHGGVYGYTTFNAVRYGRTDSGERQRADPGRTMRRRFLHSLQST